MNVEFSPEIESRLHALSTASGKPAHEYVEDAMATCLDDLAEVSEHLASRYEELVSGSVEPIDGEEFFRSLLRREEEQSRQRNMR